MTKPALPLRASNEMNFADVGTSVEGLLETAAKFSKRMIRVTLVGTGFALTAVSLAVVAHVVSPDAMISVIDVPPEVVKAIEASVTPGPAGLHDIGAMVTPLMPMGKAIAVGVLVVGLGLAILKQSIVHAGVGFAMFICLTVLPDLLQTVTGQPHEARESLDKVLMEQATSTGLTGIQERLQRGGLAASPEGRYVLAQAAAIAKKEQPTEQLSALAKAMGDGEYSSAKPNVLYAIDMAAFGEPRSQVAVEYGQGRASMASYLHTAALGVLAALGCTLVIQFVLFGIRRSIRMRIRRIQALVGGTRGAFADLPP